MNNTSALAVAAAAPGSATPAQTPSPPKKASKKSAKQAAAAQPTAVKQPKSKATKAERAAAAAAAAAGAVAEKGPNGTQSPTPTPTAKAKKDPEATTKKHATKPQSFKITREKERREKQLKQAAALAPSDAHTEPDAVKSRNHRLVLAPVCMSSLSDPCWAARRRSTSDRRADSVTDRLHDEILEYAQYTRATVESMAVHIEQMIDHVQRCVLALWPASRMEPFGSYSTGIWLPSSDVDLVILGVVEIHDRSLTVKSLRQLAQALESQPWVESLVVLDTAKIPVLKLVTAQSSVPIDISFESSATHSGLLARDLIKRYADEMPELYPLAVVFKQLLRERDLNDAYTGGLSSYSIVLMIIHFQLLWRYGERCFRAAALFASGSPLPRPADLLAEEERQQKKLAEHETTAAAAAAPTTKQSTPTITSSFAAIVSRPKSLKRPVSEAGKSGSLDDATKPSAPAQPFSYAAVAAGIAKLSTEESAKPSKAPSSYAAAVAAPAQPAKAKTKTSTAASASTAKKGDALDAISVTSSTADTEDCSDGSSTTTSAHEDTDHATTRTQHDMDMPAIQQQQQEPVEMSLGERTMTILEFYGILFDYRKNGLSVRDGGYIYRLADHVGSSGDLGKKLPSLVIEDPIHPDRNVSASSFAFSKVVAVFEDSFYTLKYFRPTRFTPSALSCLLSTSGHSQHQYQQQFHNLLANKKTASTPSNKISAVSTHKGLAIVAK